MWLRFTSLPLRACTKCLMEASNKGFPANGARVNDPPDSYTFCEMLTSAWVPSERLPCHALRVKLIPPRFPPHSAWNYARTSHRSLQKKSKIPMLSDCLSSNSFLAARAQEKCSERINPSPNSKALTNNQCITPPSAPYPLIQFWLVSQNRARCEES